MIFFDLETTGTDIVSDRIVQLAALKLSPDNSEELKTQLVNPGRPIPPEATAVHHITDEDVVGKPAFRDLAPSLCGYFSGCDIAGFNSNRFDLPLLVEEFARCGIRFPEPECKMIDVQVIYHKKEERTLSAAFRFYCNRTLENAHNAESDVRATLEVFKRQVQRYPDIGDTVEDVHRFCNPEVVVDFARYLTRNADGDIIFNFGRHKGKTILGEPDYARWMLEGEFPEATKMVIRQAICTPSDQ